LLKVAPDPAGFGDYPKWFCHKEKEEKTSQPPVDKPVQGGDVATRKGPTRWSRCTVIGATT